MKRLELSDREMAWVKRAFLYYWHTLCIGGEESTNAVVNGWDQHYTVDDYIQIWKLNSKILRGHSTVTRADVVRIRKLYGKMWRGEEPWQAFAREEKKKHDRWDNEEMMEKRK